MKDLPEVFMDERMVHLVRVRLIFVLSRPLLMKLCLEVNLEEIHVKGSTWPEMAYKKMNAGLGVKECTSI
jgi:hypothetical protein